MTAETVIRHVFVDLIPEDLQEATIYISVRHATAAHRCMSGCGREVITPLSPTDWKLTFDGRSVSLHPSVGNWSYPCQAHYWIKSNTVHWAPRWSAEQIRRGREADMAAKVIGTGDRPCVSAVGSMSILAAWKVSVSSWIRRFRLWRRDD